MHTCLVLVLSREVGNETVYAGQQLFLHKSACIVQKHTHVVLIGQALSFSYPGFSFNLFDLMHLATRNI